MQLLDRSIRLLALGCALLITPCVTLASAPSAGPHSILQDASQSTPAQPPADTTSEKEAPILLLRIDRSGQSKSKRLDPITVFADTLQTALDDSKRFRSVLYSPDQPSVKRALLEHTLAASDLIEPIQPEALERIAQAIGAHYALVLKPVVSKEGMTTEISFLTDADAGSWRTVLSDQIFVSSSSGRRRFKPDAVAALAVDDITARLGFPTHLAAAMHIAPDRVVRMAPQKPKEKPKKKTDEAKRSPDAVSGTDKTGVASGVDKNVENGVKTAPRPDEKNNRNRVVSNENPPDVINIPDVIKNPKNKRKASAHTKSPKFPLLSPEPIRPPSTSILVTPTRPDYAQMALRSQQSGDLASAITYYRRAVDGEPFDANLRRQLILVYLQRRLVDAALEEARRAQLLLPGDDVIARVYGDALYARGDIAGSLKVYRDLVKHAPQDVSAHVALADALLADNQYAEALSSYQEAARIDRKSPLPHRRLARVYAERAGGDPAQYQDSLHELELVRTLTPSTELDAYQGDYVALMHQLDARMHEMAESLQSLYESAVQGKKTATELLRVTADMKERAAALADFLDKVSPAAGMDEAHNHYNQAAALLLQAIGTFRRTLGDDGVNLQDARGELQVERADTLSELTAAAKLLDAHAEPVHAAADKPDQAQR